MMFNGFYLVAQYSVGIYLRPHRDCVSAFLRLRCDPARFNVTEVSLTMRAYILIRPSGHIHLLPLDRLLPGCGDVYISQKRKLNNAELETIPANAEIGMQATLSVESSPDPLLENGLLN